MNEREQMVWDVAFASYAAARMAKYGVEAGPDSSHTAAAADNAVALYRQVRRERKK